jgi:hypothetical protein
MVALGLLTGLVFPFCLQDLQIATPDRALSVPARGSCLTAGLLVGGLNYLLARLVVGGRLGGLAGHLRRVDDLVRTATSTGDWSRRPPQTLAARPATTSRPGRCARWTGATCDDQIRWADLTTLTPVPRNRTRHRPLAFVLTSG